MAGVSPPSLTFGNQNRGDDERVAAGHPEQHGQRALTITSIATSANFGQTNNCGGSVAAGGSCTINVTFSPTATGPLTGTLTITDNSNGVAGSTQTVTLSGTGVLPEVRLSGAKSDLQRPIRRHHERRQTVTVTNTGTGTLIYYQHHA